MRYSQHVGSLILQRRGHQVVHNKMQRAQTTNWRTKIVRCSDCTNFVFSVCGLVWRLMWGLIWGVDMGVNYNFNFNYNFRFNFNFNFNFKFNFNFNFNINLILISISISISIFITKFKFTNLNQFHFTPVYILSQSFPHVTFSNISPDDQISASCFSCRGVQLSYTICYTNETRGLMLVWFVQSKQVTIIHLLCNKQLCLVRLCTYCDDGGCEGVIERHLQSKPSQIIYPTIFLWSPLPHLGLHHVSDVVCILAVIMAATSIHKTQLHFCNFYWWTRHVGKVHDFSPLNQRRHLARVCCESLPVSLLFSSNSFLPLLTASDVRHSSIMFSKSYTAVRWQILFIHTCRWSQHHSISQYHLH